VFALTSVHNPPANGNFCDEHRTPIKPTDIQDYNRHMGNIDKLYCIANSTRYNRRYRSG